MPDDADDMVDPRPALIDHHNNSIFFLKDDSLPPNWNERIDVEIIRDVGLIYVCFCG